LSSQESPPLNGANRYAHIDAMRAFAVLLVVVAHAGLGGVVPGGSGVTIFFSISGFIITYLLLRERDKTNAFSASGFYFRRFIKIAPPFILLVILPTLISSIWTKVDWTAFFAQLLFVFNWFYMGGEVRGFDGTDVVWSLSIEEQFYIAFAVIWLVAVKSNSWRPIVAGVAALAVTYSTIARVIMAAEPGIADRIYYGSDTRLDGIAWGVLAAVTFHYLQERRLLTSAFSRALASDWTFISSVALYLISLIVRDEWFRETFRYTLQSIAASCIIVYGLLPGDGRVRRAFYSVAQWRIVSLIGLASYSIYLAHLVLMNSIRDALDVPAPVKLLILCTLGVTAGVAVYKYVELPTHRFASTLRKKRTAKSATVRH
jgi:peptidoglycan/LPS O-acetylase OafA/YrhL